MLKNSSISNEISRALFLDRDGVINIDYGYVFKREQFEFIDGIFDVCLAAKRLGYLIFVITNQAGIARGYFGESDFLEINEWMCNEFNKKGIEIKKVYYCPFHPVHGLGIYKLDSFDRKPNPGMLLRAIDEYKIDPEKSIFIGDKHSDIQAGLSAGIGLNCLYRGKLLTVEKNVKEIGNIRDLIRWL